MRENGRNQSTGSSKKQQFAPKTQKRGGPTTQGQGLFPSVPISSLGVSSNITTYTDIQTVDQQHSQQQPTVCPNHL